MVMEDHKAAVKAFADEVLSQWTPFFISVMNTKLPDPPSEQEENEDAPNAEAYRGLVSLKLQVVKVGLQNDFRKCQYSHCLGPYAHTVCLPSHAFTAESRPIRRHLVGIIVITSRIPPDVY